MLQEDKFMGMESFWLQKLSHCWKTWMEGRYEISEWDLLKTSRTQDKILICYKSRKVQTHILGHLTAEGPTTLITKFIHTMNLQLSPEMTGNWMY